MLLPPFHGERVRAYAELMQQLMDDEVARWRPGDRVAVLPIAGSLPTPAVMTYFPEFKPRTRWNVGTWRWWHHHDRLTGLLDEQITATRANPRLAERDDILAMLVQARDEDGNALATEDLRDDLVALVKEVLRIRPPVPVAAGRVLAEPFAIGPHVVPAGTVILIDAWGLHHDPRLHHDPGRFDPERFLEQAPEPYTWLPFGGGAHRCIGAGLAELEIRIALATILRSVAIAPADPELAPPARRGLTIVPHGGGRIRIASAGGEAAAAAARPAGDLRGGGLEHR